MIVTRFYRMNTSDVQQHVAHLFEHMVINKFWQWLDDRGVLRDMVLWSYGEAFEERVFIEFGCYTDELARHADEYMTALPYFDAADIKRAIGEMECEDRVLFSIVDHEQLRTQLDMLAARPWSVDGNNLEKASLPEIVSTTRSAKSFRDITIGACVSGASAEEMKVWLRLRILILDTIASALDNSVAWYDRGTSPVRRDNDSAMAGFIAVYTVRRGVVTSVQLRKKLERTMAEIDIQRALQAAEAHRKPYATQELWRSATIEYWRHTGLDATPEEIAALMTPKRIQAILRKVKFVVRAAQDSDYEYL